MGKQGSKKHGWAPKFSFRFFNMTLNNNAYKIYTVLHERKHQQDENESDRLKQLSMDEAVEELTYSLSLQGGEGVRKRTAYHPPPQRNLQYVFVIKNVAVRGLVAGSYFLQMT